MAVKKVSAASPGSATRAPSSSKRADSQAAPVPDDVAPSRRSSAHPSGLPRELRESPQAAGWRRALKPPRRLKTTREGKYFIAITFGVGFVGILTANNLLYVVLGMLLSLIVVSGVLSEMSLRYVRVVRRLPMRAQVGRPHQVEIEVFNDKKKVPSYAIEVEDLRAGQPADKRCFFLKVSPGSSQVAAYRRVPARRGLDEHVGFRVATRFPFGFFEKSREIELSDDLIVYPAVDEIRLPIPREGYNSEGAHTSARGHGDEILGLRQMRDGDDPRDIYWKRSTASGAPVVVERAREVKSRVTLSLGNTYSVDKPSRADRKAFEKRVRETASRAVAHLRRGEVVRIETSSGVRAAASPSVGADRILRFLALLELEHSSERGASHVHHVVDAPEPPAPPSSDAPALATTDLSRPARPEDAAP